MSNPPTTSIDLAVSVDRACNVVFSVQANGQETKVALPPGDAIAFAQAITDTACGIITAGATDALGDSLRAARRLVHAAEALEATGAQYPRSFGAMFTAERAVVLDELATSCSNLRRVIVDTAPRTEKTTSPFLQ